MGCTGTRGALCGETFSKVWSDEEAEAEMQAIWPGAQKEDCDVVCENCYRELLVSN